MRHSSTPIVSRGRIAVLALLACGAFLGSGASSAGAANPTILNTAVGCNSEGVNQTTWLVSCATTGENGANSSARRTRVSALVNQDLANSIDEFLTDEWGNSTSTRAVSCQKPSITGGYPRSRCHFTFTHNTSGAGISGGTGVNCIGATRWTNDRVLGVRARDTANQTMSPASNSTIKFTSAGHAGGCTDPAYIYDWDGIGANSGTFGNCGSPSGHNFGSTNGSSNQITPGSELTFCYTGDAPGSGEDFDGIRWRLRNLRTGAKGATTTSCPNNGDNQVKGVRVTFPDRGAWVVEAEMLYDASNTSCSGAGTLRAGYWFPIGSADVNSSAAPSASLSATRPQFNGNTTLTASSFSDPDAGDGGGAQVIEWDTTGNSSPDTTTIAGESQTFSSNQTKTHNTNGESPGLHTVRIWVTDNAAMDAADAIRRRSGAITATYLVDSAPTGNAQTASTESSAAAPITLTGSDPDNDPLTFSIVSGPSNGTLTGSGANRTYTPSGTFAGNDSFVFQVNDGFGRTANATVTINVTPQTQITTTPATTGPNPQFEFSSPVTSPTPTFECSLDNASFGSCGSPHQLGGLIQGQHNLRVRARVGSLIDPTPASHTWDVDATAPAVTLDTYPNAVTNQTTASFGFHADEPVTGFECELDDAGYQPCASGVDYPGLDPGDHTFKVKATDVHGNEGEPTTHTWVVDLTAPSAAIDSAPPALSNSNSASFEFSGTDNHSAPSDLGFECRLDGAATFTPCASPQGYAGLGQGSHTFRVRAIDQAGNTGDPADHTWTVDTIAPNTAINDDFIPSPPGLGHPQHRTTSPDATFDFFSNDTNATFECRLDNDPGGFAPCSAPVEYLGLADGPHKFEVRGRDQAGNVDQTPAVWEWSVLTGLPDTILDQFPANPTNQSSAHFEFHSTAPDSTFVCTIDGNVVDPCASPQDYSGVSEGQHTFEVVATDEFGRPDPSPTVYTWEVDLTAPDTTIDDRPADPSSTDAAGFTFHADEASSSFQCKLDDGDFEPCDESLPQEYTGLADGEHTFQVKATDQAGNEDPSPASYTWVVDTTAPTTTIDDQPSDPSRVVDPSFQFSSDEDPDVEFFCRLDADAFVACDSGHQVHNLGQGSHTFEVYAVDEAGSTGPTASYTWFVDLTPPDTSITQTPPALDDETGAAFEFEGADDHSDASALSFECRINSTDENDFQPCVSGDTFVGQEGQNRFEVRALDEAGNWDPSPAVYEWIADVTGPETTIDSSPDDPTNSSDAVFQFSGTDNHSAPGDLNFECELDGGGFSPCNPGDDFGPVGEGEHTFKVQATDEAGNTDATPTEYTWTVDQTAPDVSIDAQPADPTSSSAAVFEFSGTDNHSDPGDLGFECELDGGGFNPCSSGDDFGPVGEGPHTFKVRATDEAGNTGSEASYEWTVDATAPTVDITSAPDALTKETDASFEFSVGGDPTEVECKLDDGDFEPCGSPKDYTSLGDGEHTVTVRARDAAGNEETASHTWLIDATEPDTSIDDQPADPTNSSAAVFEFSGTDNHSDPGDLGFECELDGDGFNPCSSGDDFGPVGEGPHTLRVQATDQAGNTDATPAEYSWTVDETAPGVTIDSGPSGIVSDTNASFEFSSSGDPTEVECKLDTGSFEPCGSPHAYSSLGDGEHTFTVRVRDAAGNEGSDSRTWTVDTGPPDTTVDSGPQDGTTSTSASFEFSASESPADFECALDSGAFEPCTSPKGYGGLSVGSHVFRVQATDAAGNVDGSPAVHTWTIAATPSSEPQGGVAGAGGGQPPLIRKRHRALNVPAEGSFEIAHVICRSPSCTVTRMDSKIRIGGKTYRPQVSTAVAAKGSSTMTKGEVLSVIVHFPGSVQKRLLEAHVGALVINVEATADSGGAATKKRIRLKAKWLKRLFG